jgi:CRISPR/Cas system-associated exonuclease Cas4 (RecB family)
MPTRLLSAPAAGSRLERARAWLEGYAAGEELLVVAASLDAANELLRGVGCSRGAAFGWHRTTFPRLAATLAAEGLAREGAVPVGRLAGQALVARVVHECGAEGALGRFAEAAGGPGLVRALAAALDEIRLADADLRRVAEVAPELARIFAAHDAALRAAGLADRARVYALACERALDPAPHAWLGLPILLLDVPIHHARERSLVAAIAARAPDLLATVPAGDAASLASALAAGAPERIAPAGGGALARLQQHLFEGSAPGEGDAKDGVSVVSAPGESRECVEIARRVHRLAEAGTPFDRIAILLRSPEEYRPHLVEALRRAGVPAHFARGAIQPDPAGRAFVALLACAAEGLSARRFAEYASLGEVPDAQPSGVPPDPSPRAERWVAPDEEMVLAVVAEALGAASAIASRDDAGTGSGEDAPGRTAPGEDAPVAAGRLRAPRRWERLLVDAAVIGGRDRWQRRLDGLSHELALDLDALEDADDPAAQGIERNLADLAALRDYALPLLDALAALPQQAAWGEWLDALSALATRALRHPERVLAVLSELAPMAPVGPVDLAEVRLVLSRRLLELASPPSGARYGRVFVAPVEAARGLAFEVVFVPGLAEKLFPRKLDEEPILLDAPRRHIGGLPTSEERVRSERLLLRIAAGAATRELVLSYPRLDLDQSRPRVPSFYALEAMRAATGRLPGYALLARAAEQVSAARVGWPAPADPADAIDEAEHDLALLDGLLAQDPEASQGTARYLLTANPHLGRALRFRGRRWIDGWTQADGLLKVSEPARAAIAAHAITARSFSPTALQAFATCPYKFFLHTVHRLAPREVAEAIEELSPLQRGSLVHEVQFELFGALRDAELLPVTEKNLAEAYAHLDRVIEAVAARYRDDLAPAIERVWEDGVDFVKADLREWLRRASVDASGFVPWRFELSFGLPLRRDRDPHSRDEPVALDCGLRLRGSIDLIERRDDGRVRATDHKTGKERFPAGGVIAGGEVLQPVLYALAAEKLLPEATVDSGRLYYCTSAGGFEERSVPLDASARQSAQVVADVVGQALAEPFLPAAPADGACRWCDYRTVCGPYEEMRVRRKRKPELEPLMSLRKLP